MDFLEHLIGKEKELTVLQMAIRTGLIFLFSLFLIRIAGKRSFGMKMPLDNVLTILLGAILSRAIVGASPFFPTLCSAFVLTILYRVFCGLAYYNKRFGKMVKGNSQLLYKDGNIMENNMKKSMITSHDLMEWVRINSNVDSLDKIESVYQERNGEISVIKKDS
jgi:uncharacterized membrane protein YcaP (DUF421 family)